MMKCQTKRAAKGGEFGANGEFYEGGKFINSVPENRKKEGSAPKAKARKREIYPMQWEVTERKPLFSMVGTVAKMEGRNADGSFRLVPFEPGVRYYQHDLAAIQSLCDRFNAGERFYPDAG